MSLINTAVAGIQSAQIALQTTSHNIANAGVPGFSRQRIVQTSNLSMLTGAGFIGQGSHVSTVERMYSGFLTTQVNRAQTNVSELDSYYTQISQIDNMLADASSGLSPALQDFFTGVQQVAANPSQLPARQAMISSAQALVARFQGLEDRIAQMYENVNGQITATVSSINSYSTQIGALNERIIIAESSINQPANDLLDQRDQLVSELNKLVKITTSSNADGSYNVFMGNGQQLVVGALVMTMTSGQSSADSTRLTVGMKTLNGTQELPESFVGGGTLGGLLRFRNESLDRVANDLGRNAASLALTFNAQGELGQDLLGSVLGDANFVDKFFNVPTPKVIANTYNAAGGPTVSVAYTAPSFNGNFYTDLTNSDYRLSYDGTDLTLTRLTDNKAWSGADLVAINAALALEPQGFTLSDTGAAYTSGDNFLIEPTRDGARNLSVNSSVAADPRLIAAAAPIRTSVGSTNTGKAVITAGTVATAYVPPPVGGPVTLTYNTGTGTFDWPATGAILAGSVAYSSGTAITIPAAGISFTITGTPNNGDTFSIARNASGVSDGRNALLLGSLQTQSTMTGKTASFQSAYAQLVSDNGNKTREIKVVGAAQQALLDQSSAAREALSGVNLDEEAGNLIRYQQAYQASAKILDIGSKLFDVLLALHA